MLKNFIKLFVVVISILIAFFLLIQLIPYGRNHTNPPVIREPNWDTPQTRALAVRACFDCHSNETVWPWYSNIAPVSWLVQKDVEEGRKAFNFSDWQNSPPKDGEEMAEVIEENEMPPLQYLLAHPEARLSNTEKKQLINGLMATAGGK